MNYVGSSFHIFKSSILMTIEKIKRKKKRVDIGSIHNHISQTEATDTEKDDIKEFSLN